MMLMPSCPKVQNNLTEYMEGTLPFRTRMGFWVHLLVCKVCHGLLDSLKALPRRVKALLSPPIEPAPEAVETLARVMKDIRHEETP